MRISSVEGFRIALPFRERYVTASGSLDRREMMILRLASREGATGHGDAVPMSLRGGPGLAAVEFDLLRTCRETLLGREIPVEEDDSGAGAAIADAVAACAAAGAGPQALAAVDAALLDLAGRARDRPAWALLGAAEAAPVRCNGTVGGGATEAAAEAAAGLARAGFDVIKVKVGTGSDAERIRAVRSACGEGVALRVDANGAWGVERAVGALAELEPLALELAEQPCRTIEETADLRARTSVPLVLDESVATEDDAARAFGLGACDAVTLKLAKVGGPHAALRVAARAPAYLSSALDSPLGIAAALHAAQALPASGFAAGLAHGLATSSLFADNLAAEAKLGGPEIAPPPGAGLGVEIDDDALRRLSIR